VPRCRLGSRNLKRSIAASYLLIENEQFVSVVRCPPDEGHKARSFAAAINMAAAQVTRFEVALPGQLKQAEERLRKARAHTGPVEQAKAALVAVQQDPVMLAAISQARRQLEAATSQPWALEDSRESESVPTG
jgi:hypothetical protein